MISHEAAEKSVGIAAMIGGPVAAAFGTVIMSEGTEGYSVTIQTVAALGSMLVFGGIGMLTAGLATGILFSVGMHAGIVQTKEQEEYETWRQDQKHEQSRIEVRREELN